ncbi:hypothetical protein [Arthrobacter bambusae]|uniref:hypothetical protein n=1 Tax=Arthrobacter bambusae TaxID=1338426 RepID=UPI00278397F6|nr:hypothetical protein [Arthrobacter bambusae]MDQ0032060.1 hypothetical protein [Arthrobacter bambusae]MDQ0100188.1 hypothetical protein [Arthrobacter bambusae]
MTKPTRNLLDAGPTRDTDLDTGTGTGTGSRDRKLWLWIAVPAASGIGLGLAWWLLAPGGLNVISGNPALADPTASAGRLPRDLVLAGLLLLSGCFTAVLLDSKVMKPGSGIRTVLAILGGAVGALVAWQVGLLAAQWWGPGSNGNEGFSLRAVAALLLWPGATALVTFLLTLFGLMGKQPDAPPRAP